MKVTDQSKSISTSERVMPKKLVKVVITLILFIGSMEIILRWVTMWGSIVAVMLMGLEA